MPDRAEQERESGLRCNWVALLGDCDWSPFVLFERMRVYVFVRIVCETSDGLEGGGWGGEGVGRVGDAHIDRPSS